MNSFITTCYDRWKFLYQALPGMQASAKLVGGELIVVTDNEQEARKLPHGTIAVAVDGCDTFRWSFFRNVGAAFATCDRLCFIDCDVKLSAPAWSNAVNAQFDAGYDVVLHTSGAQSGVVGANTSSRFYGTSGTIAISRWVFAKINGYNHNLDGAWGGEDDDIVIRAGRAGARVAYYPASSVEHIWHSDVVRTQHTDNPRKPPLASCGAQQSLMVEDWKIHPYEANIIDRLRLPKARITVMRI